MVVLFFGLFGMDDISMQVHAIVVECWETIREMTVFDIGKTRHKLNVDGKWVDTIVILMVNRNRINH